ncbi:MAG: FtsX-like permease family protein, partial [Oscillospiraceae bacterium]
LIFGILFFKLAELGLVNIINGEINYNLFIDWQTVLFTLISFAIIFVLILLKSLFKIKISNPIELLHSENAGEKPPKANWFLGILGAISLGVAYFISLTTKSPYQLIISFFIAVLLVIIGTYLLFVSGSVLLCRILQKNKRYYYKANHFVSVSSMMYRMKRNGSGLASICILATMVLVMLSSTTSLYFGVEDSLNERYPKEFNVQIQTKNQNSINDNLIKNIDTYVENKCSQNGTVPKNKAYYKTIETTGKIKNSVLELSSNNFNGSIENIYQIYMVSLDDYNKIMGKSETLKKNEILIHTSRTKYSENSLTINKGNTFKIVKQLDEFWSDGSAAMSIFPSLFMVVSDLDYATKGISGLVDDKGKPMLEAKLTYGFDSSLNSEKQIKLCNDFSDASKKSLISNNNISSINFESRSSNKTDYYGLFGGLFFIGIILSILFISAAVLIIYYKQIVEGYEDKKRFEIMQKVGMTKKEIRKSINSQLLTVFFMPLIGAGIHLFFAFPLIQKMLLTFNLNNILLFATTTILCFLAFGFFYALIYRITSNSYYNIVSSKESD